MSIIGSMVAGISKHTQPTWLQLPSCSLVSASIIWHSRVSPHYLLSTLLTRFDVGFVGSLGANVSIQALHLGRIGWCLSFVLGFVVYWALSIVWPHRNIQATKGLGREELAKQEFVTLIIDGLDQNQDHKFSNDVKVEDVSRSEEDV